MKARVEIHGGGACAMTVLLVDDEDGYRMLCVTS